MGTLAETRAILGCPTSGDEHELRVDSKATMMMMVMTGVLKRRRRL
jgi:hypothetical protein